MSKVSYYTAEGLKKLREELNYLKDIEQSKSFSSLLLKRVIKEISLKTLRYDAAKESQGLLEFKNC